jgi:hypothetical protein
VLVWGEPDDLRRLSTALGNLVAEAPSIRLNDLEQCLSADGTVLLARVTAQGKGLTQHPASQKTYVWEIRPRDLPQFVGKIDALAASEGSGHQYLESSEIAENQIVIISKDEYPDDFLMLER